ncbi:TonB family protein [Nibribacter ruber]|uniref:TonB family protein n=1 Tax=Nibribacter ruber TaxID=2698458 RepID=A0A6P1NTJ7_9BACT|nr:energy transducer TonB [Nibribacter ruber]QHL87196.1 TonB family protein [Nibribacter ruber]
METNHNTPETLNDMVFEGRNKAYGAYALRKMYPKHLTLASFYAVGLFVFLFTFPALVSKVTGKAELPIPIVKPNLGTIKITDVKLAELKLPQEPAVAPPPPAGPTVQHTTYKVVEQTNQSQEDIPTQEDLKQATASLATSEGNGEAVANELPVEGGVEGGLGTTPDVPAAEKPEIFLSVEKMPEFEGGMPALMKFVSKNLRYPPAAQRSGIEGTVVISFVVSPTGDITDLAILKGLGYGTEEEVMRVVKKMPRWKPGYQNGNAVPVRFTMPIRLEVQ